MITLIDRLEAVETIMANKCTEEERECAYEELGDIISEMRSEQNPSAAQGIENEHNAQIEKFVKKELERIESSATPSYIAAISLLKEWHNFALTNYPKEFDIGAKHFNLGFRTTTFLNKEKAI